MSVVYICGHLHPDTDSICSALAYESLKNALGGNTLAVRAGALTPETRWVLERFKVKTPPEIRDLRTQVLDLSLDKPSHIMLPTPLRKAWEQMQICKLKSLPVVDENLQLTGIVTLGDLSEFDLNADISKVLSIPSKNLCETLTPYVIGKLPDIINATLHLYRNSKKIPEGCIVFCEKITRELISQSMESGVQCLVQCNTPPESIRIKKSELDYLSTRLKLVLMFTPLDCFTAIRYSQQSVSIGAAIHINKLVSIPIDAYLDEVTELMLSSRFRCYPVVDENNYVLGSISRYHLLQPIRKKVILVDHNEMSQSVRGLFQAEVLEIIDHHRLGDIQTSGPLFFRNEPVGCTSTIIAGMFFESGIKPEPSIAGLMLCAILSDTVLFKSPTCTLRDIAVAEQLADLANVDITELGREMFKGSESLSNMTPIEVLFLDFKEFFLGDNKIGIGQVSCIDINQLAHLSNSVHSVMEEIGSEQRFDLLLFMETDIDMEGTRIYYTGHLRKELSRAFNIELKENSFFLPGVMSRKKQVIPALSAVLR